MLSSAPLFSAPTLRRAAAGALGALAGAGALGALAGAAFCGALAVSPAAQAQPAPPPPPGCTAADFSRVGAGVSQASSTYLFAHPEANTFFTSLHGLPDEEQRVKVREYYGANPQIRDELTAIRQPLTDIKNRCGFSAADRNGPNVP